MLLTAIAIVGTVFFGTWGVLSACGIPGWQIVHFVDRVARSKPVRAVGLTAGLLVIAALFLGNPARRAHKRFEPSRFAATRPIVAPVVPLNPRALFEESRMGVTRSDVRDTLRDAENRVPDTLRDIESRLPQRTADIEREMMRNASKYGLSASDVRAQVQAIESQARQQVRGMEGDVRRQIRNSEDDVWENLRRMERGY
jgi:ElaB/YqjD/DUF883 family membrane-anchored ribosome-binding protein